MIAWIFALAVALTTLLVVGIQIGMIDPWGALMVCVVFWGAGFAGAWDRRARR